MKFSRRNFIRTGAIISANLVVGPSLLKAGGNYTTGYPVRLGGPVHGNIIDPGEWVRAVKSLGYPGYA